MARREVRMRTRAGAIGLVVVVELVVAALLVPSSGADLLVTTPRVSIGDVAVVEGDGPKTQLRFTVNLSEATANQVTVDYATADGTATAPVDYKAKARTLTFKPGQTSKGVTITVFGDVVEEPEDPAEVLTVTLSNPTGGAVPGRMQGTGTILEDDAQCVPDQYEENDQIGERTGALGSVSGDMPSPPIEVLATTCPSLDSDWYYVTVREDTVLATALSVAVGLTASDADSEYRISAYGPSGELIGHVDTLLGQGGLIVWWADDGVGADCGQTIYIEVRPLTDRTGGYTMELVGNVPPSQFNADLC